MAEVAAATQLRAARRARSPRHRVRSRRRRPATARQTSAARRLQGGAGDRHAPTNMYRSSANKTGCMTRFGAGADGTCQYEDQAESAGQPTPVRWLRSWSAGRHQQRLVIARCLSRCVHGTGRLVDRATFCHSSSNCWNASTGHGRHSSMQGGVATAKHFQIRKPAPARFHVCSADPGPCHRLKDASARYICNAWIDASQHKSIESRQILASGCCLFAWGTVLLNRYLCVQRVYCDESALCRPSPTTDPPHPEAPVGQVPRGRPCPAYTLRAVRRRRSPCRCSTGSPRLRPASRAMSRRHRWQACAPSARGLLAHNNS